MEENRPDQKNEKLELNNQAIRMLSGAAGWARFLSIVMYVAVGFVLLSMIITLASPPRIPIPSYGYGMSMSVAGPSIAPLMIMYVVMIVIYGFMAYFLGSFASKAKRAVADNDERELATSMGFLNKFFTLQGILVIVVMVVVFIGLLVFLFSDM